MPAKTTVQIKPALLNKLKRYQTETGISITYCVEEAIGDWIESTMPMRLSAYRRQHATKTNPAA